MNQMHMSSFVLNPNAQLPPPVPTPVTQNNSDRICTSPEPRVPVPSPSNNACENNFIVDQIPSTLVEKLSTVIDKLNDNHNITKDIVTQLVRLRQDISTQSTSSTTQIVDCFTKYFSGTGMTDTEMVQKNSLVRRCNLLFHYTRFVKAMQFCQPAGVVDLYMKTLEPEVYDDKILIDGALIICNNNRTEADSFLHSKLKPPTDQTTSQCSSPHPSRLKRHRTSESGTNRRRGSTVAREAANAQSRLHETIKIDAV